MSLHFNWNRLDETCAEALRQLINKRLAEVVERINSKNAATAATQPASPGAPAPSSSMPTAAAGPMSQGKGGAAGSVAGSVGPSTALSGLGAASPGMPSRADPSANASPHGPSREIYGAMLSAAELPPHSAFLSAGSANPYAVTSNPSTGPQGNGAGSNTPHNSVGLPPRAEAMRGGGAEEAALYAAATAASAPGIGLPPPRLPVTAAAAAAGGAAASTAPALPLSGNGGSGANPQTMNASSGTAESRKVPPLVYLEVGSVEWGATPPFVEIVAFENATDGPPGYHRPAHHGLATMSSSAAMTPVGDGRDGVSYGVSRVASTDNTAASSSLMMGGYGGQAAAAAAGTGAPGHGGEVAVDNASESSHDFPGSHSMTGANTPHLVTGGHPIPLTSGAVAGVAAAAVPSAQNAVSLSQFPSQPETTDSLASVLGTGGLHIRFHITYGGALHLSLNTAVQHEIRLGAVALRVSLPMMFYLANLDLDCYLCINIKNNVCQIWLEHGPLSSSVVNRLSITATFGGDSEMDADTGDFGASSTDFYSRYGSSSISDDDEGEGGGGVYVNEHEVSQFVLHELRAILKETIVAPHCISVPITFAG